MSCPRPSTPRSDPKDIGELAEPLRSRLHTLMGDAPDRGLVLVSGFRDPGRQWDLRHERCPGRECDRGCRGVPLTAVPGRSNHQKRTAADIGGTNLTWANRVKASYGLATPVKGEPWHFEAAGRPTVAIRTWPAGGGGGSPVAVRGSSGAPPFPGRILAQPPAAKGDDVRRLQQQLLARGWKHGWTGGEWEVGERKALRADGTYGAISQSIVRRFQLEKGLGVDGKVGRITWESVWSSPIT